jgi:hypothetical protein
MGVVGQWDPELFARFRKASPIGALKKLADAKPRRPMSALTSALLNELTRINEPLIKVLVAQLGGREPSAHAAATMRNSMRLPGAESLEWDEALNIGRFAFCKAIDVFDPTKGKISMFLKWKLFYELQCAVAAANMIHVDRGERPPGMEYLEDDDHLGRLALEDDSGGIVEFAVDVALDAQPLPLVVAIAPVVVVPTIAVPAFHVEPDLRHALDVFLDDHCRFASGRHEASSSLRGRQREVANAYGEIVIRAAFDLALRSRGATASTMRVPWSSSPVRGFLGVCLQSAADVASAVH